VQEVKVNLNILQERHGPMKINKPSIKYTQMLEDRIPNIGYGRVQSGHFVDNDDSYLDRAEIQEKSPVFRRDGSYYNRLSNDIDRNANSESLMSNSLPESDYRDERITSKLAELLFAQYSMEEIIFELSKIVFEQTLTSGNRNGELAFQKFAEFLESRVKQGRIPADVQKKVTDIMLAALMDTITERPELSASMPGPVLIERLVNGGGEKGNFQDLKEQYQSKPHPKPHLTLNKPLRVMTKRRAM